MVALIPANGMPLAARSSASMADSQGHHSVDRQMGRIRLSHAPDSSLAAQCGCAVCQKLLLVVLNMVTARCCGTAIEVTVFGGAAQVYLARWNYTEVAVKVLHVGENPRQQEEFRRGEPLARPRPHSPCPARPHLLFVRENPRQQKEFRRGAPLARP